VSKFGASPIFTGEGHSTADTRGHCGVRELRPPRHPEAPKGNLGTIQLLSLLHVA
jgi:hypothetical protein